MTSCNHHWSNFAYYNDLPNIIVTIRCTNSFPFVCASFKYRSRKLRDATFDMEPQILFYYWKWPQIGPIQAMSIYWWVGDESCQFDPNISWAHCQLFAYQNDDGVCMAWFGLLAPFGFGCTRAAQAWEDTKTAKCASNISHSRRTGLWLVSARASGGNSFDGSIDYRRWHSACAQLTGNKCRSFNVPYGRIPFMRCREFRLEINHGEVSLLAGRPQS